MKTNKRVLDMRAPLAARREPAMGPEQAAKCAICFEHKTKNILIHAPHTRIVAFWRISNICPKIS